MLPDKNKNEANSPDTSAEYQFAGYRVDTRQRRLYNPDGDILNLSSRAFDTLLALLERHGDVLSKAALMSVVWPNVVVEENNLNQAISSLRKALGDTKNESRFILTIPGRGYSFIAPLERLQTSQAQVADVLLVGNAAAANEVAATQPVAASAAVEEGNSTGAARSRHALLLPFAAALLLGITLAWWLPRPDQGSDAIIAGQPAASATALPSSIDVIRNSVAVLPFTNLNPDADNSLFTLGLHDEVINQLSKISSLNVISRHSVLGLVGQDLPTADIARVLRVESVMSGTLLFAGDQVRVNLQLLNPQNGLMLWSGNYEANTKDLADMIAVQSEIAAQVANALEAEVRQSERDSIASLPTSSFQAYRYNLAAKNAYDQQDFVQGWSLSRQAIELDPTYFDALFNYSSVNLVLVATPLPGMTGKEHFEQGLESAERMIELQPGNSAGYALKAIALGTQSDWNGVAEMTARLEAMNVPLSERKYIALLLLCLGKFDEAIEIYQANLITEPLNYFGRGFLMHALELAGRSDAADAEYRLGEELSPVWWGDQVNIFLALGRGEPLQDIDELFIPPDLKQVLHRAGDKQALRAAVDAYVARPDKVSAETVYYAALAAHLGDDALSVTLMRSALQDVWTSLYWFWLPVFDEARKLDDFKQLLRESGVIEYWRQHGWPPVCQPLGDDFSCDWSARTAL